ncbi:type II toxin-antitoxin system RelE/ParE family toxin [Pusillimonas sp.]|uniref:type II toxin-antitoxin system RelE/ParE family toxin n=1 Tax=Pusillimonas sp. TaxID=3040095 RepID=UPI0029B4A60A|nr:type II toxin-antitoxin system RelE/ParE family toxin [Pusillimonas sp.]MDX3895301.1 type II toxin-antitoxin system RelE/ParE family toxin [Pusillimonas sp.]
MHVFKRKAFLHWQKHQRIHDSALCRAIKEMESGLIDAALGSSLYKMRVRREGAGKSSSYRLLLSARIGSRYVFLHGFSKSDRSTITQHETKALQYAGKVFLNLNPEALFQALNAGVLIKVDCDEQTH